MTKDNYDAIVIGAGHNGLVTAGYLAQAGLSVLVLERLDKLGGAVTTDEFAPGFLGPMCSYISYILQGKVVDDLKLRNHGFELIRRPSSGGPRSADSSSYSEAPMESGIAGDAWGIHVFPDGTYLGGPNVANDFDSAHQIAEFSERDARKFFEWRSFWDDAAGILAPYFLTDPPTIADLMSDVRGTRQEGVLEKLLTWSYVDAVTSTFEDARVQAHFMAIMEMNPSAPGSMLGPAMERAGMATSRPADKGIPRMSMGNITSALVSSVRSLGVDIRTRAPVSQVMVEGGLATGVRLANGETITARTVVSNADPKRTYRTMLDGAELAEDTVRRANGWKTNAGCVKFLAAMAELPDLSRYLGAGYNRNAVSTIQINESLAYHQQSWDDCEAGKPSTCPIMDIQLTSVTEPGLVRSRAGHVMSNWVVYEAPELAEGDWSDIRDSVGEQIIDVITAYAPNFRDSLIEWSVQTPVDIDTRVGMTDGNIFHLDMVPSQLLSQRHPYRTEIKHMYMCGSGTHPMGGVSGAPGHNAARTILQDLGRAAAV